MHLKRLLIMPLRTKAEREVTVQILRDLKITSKSSLTQFELLRRRAYFLV
jgi:hypothetical protein